MHIDTVTEYFLPRLWDRAATMRWASAALVGAMLIGSPLARADVLAFDRGLPIENLNNEAGADRSNIEWADIETMPETPWLPGDDFTLAGNGSYVVSTIRVWSTDNVGLALWGGAAGAPIHLISKKYAATPVTYVNSEGYQTTAGDFLPLYQIDFSVDIPLEGGVTYQYFLDGPPSASDSDFRGPRLHASNAASSGSPQMGADDTFLFLGNDGTVYTWNTLTGEGTYCPGCVGWNKTSDGNVQVFVRRSGPVLPAVFDRGLPTDHLNNEAGLDRSNIEWADIETLPETPWLPGDDFTLAGNGRYAINGIRVWSTDSAGLRLWGGAAGTPMGVISTTYTAIPVTYANGEGYQTSAGDFLPLYQIDFDVDVSLNGGVTYQYFLDGPAAPDGSDFRGVRMHASNAALSGAPQTGSDDTFLFLGNDGTVYTWNTLTGDGTYCPGCVGWNKTSDGNVQVFAPRPFEHYGQRAPISGSKGGK
jgi:hypothetical protein